MEINKYFINQKMQKTERKKIAHTIFHLATAMCAIIAYLKGKLSEIRCAIIIHLNFIWCVRAHNFANASH